MLRGRGGEASKERLGVCFVGLVVRGSYVWCLVPFFLFMGFGIWRKKEMRDALKSLFGVAMQDTSRGGDNFNGEGGFPPCNYAALKLYCKLYWTL